MKFKSFLLKQYNIGSGIGAFNTLWGKAFVYVGMMNLVFNSITVWEVSIKSYLSQYISWINFPSFVMVITLLIGSAMLLVFKFSLQSDVRFNMWANWVEDNPVRVEFEKAEARQDEMEGKQLEMDAKLEKILKILESE